MNKLMTALLRLARGAPADAMLEITELKQRVDSAGGLVLDVRSADEFNSDAGHIVDAMNIPVEELEARWSELGGDFSRPIAVMCRTDKRSTRAAQFLTSRGYLDVRVVRGGMSAWHARGWPVQLTPKHTQ